MDFKEIIYSVADSVATITLNRPQAMNSLTHEMAEEWAKALEMAQWDVNVRAVIVTGAGRAFCGGANPRRIAADREQAIQAKPPPLSQPMGLLYTVHQAVQTVDKPYIAAVNGGAAGGGMDMACAADIRFASDRAKFTTAYVRMGNVPGGGGAWFLPRLVGLPNAYELIWTGKVIDAQEAYRIGLVSRVVPHDDLMAVTREFAVQLAKGPTVTIRLAKRLVRQCAFLDLPAALQATEEMAHIARSTEDAQEGPRAWLEKREPVFKGR
ncbi:MAG: enoyl-CoA hydratase/isomerase family protein [Chloroflexi bacterium]|nr:enoyl-CoA hydratase/isomerase family protein [Chloroflexota bacterium]